MCQPAGWAQIVCQPGGPFRRLLQVPHPFSSTPNISIIYSFYPYLLQCLKVITKIYCTVFLTSSVSERASTSKLLHLQNSSRFVFDLPFPPNVFVDLSPWSSFINSRTGTVVLSVSSQCSSCSSFKGLLFHKLIFISPSMHLILINGGK